MTTGLTDFFQYHRWANLRMLDACSQLTDDQLDTTTKGVFGSIRESIMHLIGADEGYARSVTGTGPTPILKEFSTFAGFDLLRKRAEMSGEALIAASKQRDLDRVLHLDGGTYDAQAIVVLIQAINHGVDHRSQISTLLSLLDIEPPELDGWSYNDLVLR